MCKGQFCGTGSGELPEQKRPCMRGRDMPQKATQQLLDPSCHNDDRMGRPGCLSKPEAFDFKSTNHLELTMARFRLHVVNSSKFQLVYPQKALLRPFQLFHHWHSLRVCSACWFSSSRRRHLGWPLSSPPSTPRNMSPSTSQNHSALDCTGRRSPMETFCLLDLHLVEESTSPGSGSTAAGRKTRSSWPERLTMRTCAFGRGGGCQVLVVYWEQCPSLLYGECLDCRCR